MGDITRHQGIRKITLGTTRLPLISTVRGVSEVIDFDGPVPVYRQLAAILRDKIKSGEIPPARPIPSKRSLKETYGVGASTVDRAVGLLREEGLLETVLGKGLFVCRRLTSRRASAKSMHRPSHV
jgi:GntR family transcriptional regulator